MTDQRVTSAIEALRGLLTSGVSLRTEEDDEGRVDVVLLELGSPVEVAGLEAVFGSASTLPTTPAGQRSVTFPQTHPGEGESSWSVFGYLADDGTVIEVMLRLDET